MSCSLNVHASVPKVTMKAELYCRAKWIQISAELWVFCPKTSAYCCTAAITSLLARNGLSAWGDHRTTSFCLKWHITMTILKLWKHTLNICLYQLEVIVDCCRLQGKKVKQSYYLIINGIFSKWYYLIRRRKFYIFNQKIFWSLWTLLQPLVYMWLWSEESNTHRVQ